MPFSPYAANYLIDLDHAVIVDVEASRAIRQAEVGAARTTNAAFAADFFNGIGASRPLPLVPAKVS